MVEHGGAPCGKCRCCQLAGSSACLKGPGCALCMVVAANATGFAATPAAGVAAAAGGGAFLQQALALVVLLCALDDPACSCHQHTVQVCLDMLVSRSTHGDRPCTCCNLCDVLGSMCSPMQCGVLYTAGQSIRCALRWTLRLQQLAVHLCCFWSKANHDGSISCVLSLYNGAAAGHAGGSFASEGRMAPTSSRPRASVPGV
jgi:hypothetical protein